jgi:protocatechuate 3,4-dioxygenase beta subunit
LTADTNAPVRRAQVRISGSDILPKTAVTDADGRYEFRDLPAGRFTLTASKAGFVTINYGQTRPFEAGKALELAEGQALDKADFTIPRGSAISGRIVDEFGEPIADAQVSAMRSTWMNGRRRLQSTGRMAQTNDLGQYRIYGLPPGEYYVSATVGAGAAEMVMVERVAATFVAAGGSSSGGPSASDPRSGYAPTYYPGTPNGHEAQKIALSIGQEMTSADFSLLPVRLVRITGTVIGSDGRPLEGAMISSAPRNSAEAAHVLFPIGGSARTDKNGNFTLNNVAPGEYTLTARGVQVVTSSGEGGDRMVFTMTRMIGGDGNTEFGSVPISVGGEDLSNVMIVTSKGTTVSGRVVFEGAKPANTAPIRVSMMAIDADGPMAMPGGSASLTPEGTFEIKGVMGQRLVRVNGLPAGWVLKSVTAGGTDVTDDGIDVKPNEPLTGLEIVVTQRGTDVTGGVTGDDARPVTDYTLVIFSEDESKWTAPMTRHVTGVRPNQDGRFQVKNLPAWNYYAIAVEYIATGDWQDPEVLHRLKARATRFRLDEGAAKTLDLKLAGS